MSTLSSVILASTIVSLISLTGSVFLIKKDFLTKYAFYLVSFAAGVLLSTALLDLLPESVRTEHTIEIQYPILFGIVFLFLLERFLIWFHHHDNTHNTKPSVYLILFGDGIHNFFDGIAIATTFLANPKLGVITTLAIIAHEIPQEIADFTILIHDGLSKTKALFFNFISALAALLGAVLGVYFLSKLQYLLPTFLAFTAGTFIYITCSDLIPDLHHDFKEHGKWAQTIPFVFGIVLMWLLIRLVD